MRTRHLQIVGLLPEARDHYLHLHSKVWPEVEARLRLSNIHNYTIFIHNDLLFGYFEHDGTDIAADLEAMKADPVTREWWSHTGPCQVPLPEAKAVGAIWANAEEVWHLP